MAFTFTEQANLPPASANSLTADGEGMHSLVPHDLVRGLNNLGTYVNNHLHYVQGSPATTLHLSGRVSVTYTGTARECFLLEVPVFAPLWAVRMVWTAGARCVAVSQSNVKLYLAKTPYIGSASSAFDTTLLATGYKTRTVSVSITTGQYSLADDSSTGITPIDDNATTLFSPGIGSNTKRKGYAIVTATGGTNATVGVEDITLWFLPS